MKPTQEQIKEFWEWCGFRFVEDKGYDYTLREWEVHYPNGEWHHAYKSEIGELIDLNNLFKYAVPFVVKKYGLAIVRLELLASIFRAIKEDKDPPLALF